jgi:hypothetical protein
MSACVSALPTFHWQGPPLENDDWIIGGGGDQGLSGSKQANKQESGTEAESALECRDQGF